MAEGRRLPADRWWADPASILADAGFVADPWQAVVLDSVAYQVAMLCSRQTGKTFTASAMVAMTALRDPGSLTLILSPSQRQSSEMLSHKVVPFYRALCRSRPEAVDGPGQLVEENKTSLEFASGSRIVALPDNIKTIAGFSGAALLVIDEASQASDELYYTVRPMMATSQGRIVCLSTPFGKRGFFYELWEKGENWMRSMVTAAECPRITPEFLAQERKEMGERWFMQNYFCVFNDSVDSFFSAEDIEKALTYGVAPMFPAEE
jgi:hypothetical protein